MLNLCKVSESFQEIVKDQDLFFFVKIKVNYAGDNTSDKYVGLD